MQLPKSAFSEVRSQHLAHHEALCTLPRSSIRRTPYIAATAPGNGSAWRESIASMA